MSKSSNSVHTTYHVVDFLRADLTVLCDGSRMRTTIHYVVIKPDSRPDGTAIRDHAHVHVYTSSREKMRHKL